MMPGGGTAPTTGPAFTLSSAATCRTSSSHATALGQVGG